MAKPKFSLTELLAKIQNANPTGEDSVHLDAIGITLEALGVSEADRTREKILEVLTEEAKQAFGNLGAIAGGILASAEVHDFGVKGTIDKGMIGAASMQRNLILFGQYATRIMRHAELCLNGCKTLEGQYLSDAGIPEGLTVEAVTSVTKTGFKTNGGGSPMAGESLTEEVVNDCLNTREYFGKIFDLVRRIVEELNPRNPASSPIFGGPALSWTPDGIKVEVSEAEEVAEEDAIEDADLTEF